MFSDKVYRNKLGTSSYHFINCPSLPLTKPHCLKSRNGQQIIRKKKNIQDLLSHNSPKPVPNDACYALLPSMYLCTPFTFDGHFFRARSYALRLLSIAAAAIYFPVMFQKHHPLKKEVLGCHFNPAAHIPVVCHQEYFMRQLRRN